MLLELLTKETIRLGIAATNKEEAIRSAGKILVDMGKVKPSYVDAMVKLSIEIPGYIVLAPGLAMPHARPESGVEEIGMSLITLEEPVPFQNTENDPVSVVVALAAIDSNTHLQLLQQFSEVFGDDEIVGKIAACTQADQVTALLKAGLGTGV